MFMRHHSIIKFIAHRVQHDVAYIIVMVMQVHGSMNQKYKLSDVNRTRSEDIKTFSLWKEFFSTYKLVDMFATNVPTTILLKNVSSTMKDEVKLISTSNSIILTLIPNTKAHEQLKLVHKALTNETSFWTKLGGNFECLFNLLFFYVQFFL